MIASIVYTNMHDKEFDYQLLVRFIDGTANETEQERVLAWINNEH